MNIRQIKWIVCCAVLLVAYGCSEDLDPMYGDRDRGGTPVCFTAEWPDESGMAGTRAIEDKREFAEGNVMHVSGVFYLNEKTLKEGEENHVTKYAALTYQNGEWVNLVTDKKYDMDWPWNAERAEFTAYHMEQWNGPITKENTPLDPVVLDRFVYDENHIINPDPLWAKSGEVEYGHAVKLKFEHLCTRLTITDVADADEYELRFKSNPDNPSPSLSNACTMTRNTENELTFEFVNEESNRISSQVDVDGANTRSVTFHLKPDNYSTFTLTRRNGYSYITLSNVTELNDLQAGKAYTVSLENLRGNIIPEDPDDDWWKPEDMPPPAVNLYDDFSVQAFMEAIRNCTGDYTCKLKDSDTPKTLLKYDPNRKEMRLMDHVNFNWDKTYEPVELPNLVTFDGGGKTIWNISRSLFSTLYGTVTELNLREANLEHTEEPTAAQDAGHDTGWGVLARVCNNGNISNVHLIDATLDIVFHNSRTENRTYCAGALVGNMISGTMRHISLVNDISVTVKAQHEDVRYTSCVGGVVGQATGTLEDIDHEAPDGQPLLKVTNNCKGISTHYTGGVVGLLPGGKLDLCDMRTIVDASGVRGTWNYAGGIAGAVRTEGVIANAVVAGSVTGGAVIDDNSETHSSTGGIVGHVQAASVTGGIAFNQVSISPGYTPGDRATYSIGGVIGSIKEAKAIIDNEGHYWFDTGIYKELPNYYAGTFAGILNNTTLGINNTSEGIGNEFGIGGN